MNDVKFSPDARLVASASFDKSIRVRNDPMDLLFCLNPLFTSFPKVWCGKTGRFLMTLRGHVQAVYQVHLPEQSSIQFPISQGGLGGRQSPLGVGLGGLHPQALVDGDEKAAH